MASVAKDAEKRIELGGKAQDIAMEIKNLEKIRTELELLEYKEKIMRDQTVVTLKELVESASIGLIGEIMEAEKNCGIIDCLAMNMYLLGKIQYLRSRMEEAERREKSEEEKKKLEEEVKKLKEMVEKNIYKRDSYRGTVGFGRRIYNKIVCYVCGDEGHKAMNCSKRVNKNSDSYRVVKIENKRQKCNDEFRNIDDLISYFRGRVNTDENSIIEYCRLEKCKINTVNGKIIQKRGLRIPQALERQAVEYLSGLEKRKIIRPSNSIWRNPVRFIEKEKGGIRMVLNLAALNDLVIKDCYELRTIKDIIRATVDSNWFTIIDLKEAFYSIEIEEEDKHKTCFEFKGEVYEFNAMVMGFKNSPMILQRVMTTILKDLLGNGVEVYQDDIVIHTKERHDHDGLVIEVIERLLMNKMRINLNKMQFALNEVSLLGYKLNGNDIVPLDKQKKKVMDWPKPKNISECRKFLGLVNWFRTHIKELASKTYYMYRSLSVKNDRGWKWMDNMDNEFKNIKEEIKNIKTLAILNYNKELILRTDASNIGIGAVLMQRNDAGELTPIEWASKKLTLTESRYGITEKEMYAVYWGVKRFDYELRGRKFVLETDHKALEQIRVKPFFENNRVNTWMERLMEYDFIVRYIKGSDMGMADELSRGLNSKEETTKIISEKIKKSKWNKHVITKEGYEFWRFDNGDIRKIIPAEERKNVCKEYHEKLLHRGFDAVYYEMKKEFYWPGIKYTISDVLAECDVCQINNRKNKKIPEYVTTTRPMEKVASDLLNLENEDCYVLVGIDYFSRYISTAIIKNKSGDSVIEKLKLWFQDGYIPDELITDNGKEFCNTNMREFLSEIGIEHRKVSVENHRSNGRVERVIGTLREYLKKHTDGNILDRVKDITRNYNSTYHSSIKCSPKEALKKYGDVGIMENNMFNRKKGKLKTKSKENIELLRGDKVRIAQNENISKYDKGRFLRNGSVVEKCGKDSYLVRIDDTGRIVKKNISDLKKMNIKALNGLTAEGGDVGP